MGSSWVAPIGVGGAWVEAVGTGGREEGEAEAGAGEGWGTGRDPGDSPVVGMVGIPEGRRW
jgi:hypothetical protein